MADVQSVSIGVNVDNYINYNINDNPSNVTGVSSQTSNLKAIESNVEELDLSIDSVSGNSSSEADGFLVEVKNFFDDTGAELKSGFTSISDSIGIFLKKTGATVVNTGIAVTTSVVSVAKGIVNTVTNITAAAITPFIALADIIANNDNFDYTQSFWNDIIKPYVEIDSGEDLANLIYDSKAGQAINNNAANFMKKDETGYEITKGVGRVLGILLFAYASVGVAGIAGGTAGATAETTEALTFTQKIKAFFNTMRLFRITTAGIVEAGDKTSEAWREDDASITDGIKYGLENGAFESIQWILGELVGEIKIGSGTSFLSKFSTSTTKILLDGADAAIDTPIRAIFKGYNGNSFAENFEKAGGYGGMLTNFIVGAGMSSMNEAIINFGPKLKGIIGKIFNNEEAGIEITTELNPNSLEITTKIFDSEHGYQVSTDDFGGIIKHRVENGFFMEGQVDNILDNINSKGYMDMNTGEYLKGYFQIIVMYIIKLFMMLI